jgi:hypothetical protein
MGAEAVALPVSELHINTGTVRTLAVLIFAVRWFPDSDHLHLLGGEILPVRRWEHQAAVRKRLCCLDGFHEDFAPRRDHQRVPKT